MGQKGRGLFLVFCIGVVVFAVGCGGSSGGNPEEQGTDVITTNELAMASIPSADPSSLDYALVSNPSGMIVKALGIKEEGGEGEDSAIKVKIVHAPAASGAGLGNFKLYLCRFGEPAGYANYDIASDLYSGTLIFNDGERLINAITSIPAGAITDDDFQGSVEFVMSQGGETSGISISGSGATETNTLQGVKGVGGGVACVWNASLGCASFIHPEHGSFGPVAFALSGDASTKGKSYSATNDDSMCASVPQVQTSIAAASGLPADMWDCQIPDPPANNEAVFEVGSAVDLENNGGEGCVAGSDHWENFAGNVDDCMGGGGPPTAVEAGCFCDALYGMGSNKYRQHVMRKFLCKVKGVFTLKDQLGVSLEAGKTVYLNIASIGGGDNGGGGDQGGQGGDDQVDGCYCTAFCTNMDATPAPDDMVAACNACCATGTGVEACLTGVCSGIQTCLDGVAQACP